MYISFSAGGVACNIYSSGMEAAKKYGVYDKLKSAGSATVSKLNDISNEHQLKEKAYVLGGKAVCSILSTTTAMNKLT